MRQLTIGQDIKSCCKQTNSKECLDIKMLERASKNVPYESSNFRINDNCNSAPAQLIIEHHYYTLAKHYQKKTNPYKTTMYIF